MDIKFYSGSPFPLGANWDGQGVNFAFYAENATGVELCLFNSKDEKTIFSAVRVRHLFVTLTFNIRFKCLIHFVTRITRNKVV